MVFPTCLMDLVWMTQNLLAIIKLCFGHKSSSAIFLSNWAAHMYKHKITYASLQGSDPAFYVKVLYTIDIALQQHWKSCCESNDCQEVNDQVLMNQDKNQGQGQGLGNGNVEVQGYMYVRKIWKKNEKYENV
jgi:hypothetical protein